MSEQPSIDDNEEIEEVYDENFEENFTSHTETSRTSQSATSNAAKLLIEKLEAETGKDHLDSTKQRITTIKELVNDFESAREENERLREKLSQYESTLNFMRKTAQQRDEYIRTLEEELRKLRITTKQELEIFAEEMKTKALEDQHRAQILAFDKDRLQDQLNVYRFYERENKNLRDTIKDLQSQVERVNKISTMESEKSVVEMENWKRQLELDYQLRSQENQANAYLDLDIKSREAVEATVIIKDHFMKQNSGLEEMVTRLRLLQGEHNKLKEVTRANERERREKEQQIQELHEQLVNKQEKVFDLENHLQYQISERQSYELLFTEMETLCQELSRTREKYEATKNELEKWKSRAKVIQFIDENNLTPLTIKNITKKKNEIILSACKKCEEQDEYEQETCVRFGASGTQWGQLPAMQALSIWNSGFPTNKINNPYYQVEDQFDPMRQKSLEEQKNKFEKDVENTTNAEQYGKENVFKEPYNDDFEPADEALDMKNVEGTRKTDKKKKHSLKTTAEQREEADQKLSVLNKERQDKKLTKKRITPSPSVQKNLGSTTVSGLIELPFVAVTNLSLTKTANGSIAHKRNSIKQEDGSKASRFLVP